VSFYTAVNCMDGRAQQPVIDYLTGRFGVDHVDMITEPGPNGILNRRDATAVVDSILRRIDVSVHHHGSIGMAIIGHYDCAGNSGNKAQQIEDVRGAIVYLRSQYPDLPIIGLWIDETWTVSEVGLSV
jgi:hypothetical protein